MPELFAAGLFLILAPFNVRVVVVIVRVVVFPMSGFVIVPIIGIVIVPAIGIVIVSIIGALVGIVGIVIVPAIVPIIGIVTAPIIRIVVGIVTAPIIGVLVGIVGIVGIVTAAVVGIVVVPVFRVVVGIVIVTAAVVGIVIVVPLGIFVIVVVAAGSGVVGRRRADRRRDGALNHCLRCLVAVFAATSQCGRNEQAAGDETHRVSHPLSHGGERNPALVGSLPRTDALSTVGPCPACSWLSGLPNLWSATSRHSLGHSRLGCDGQRPNACTSRCDSSAIATQARPFSRSSPLRSLRLASRSAPRSNDWAAACSCCPPSVSTNLLLPLPMPPGSSASRHRTIPSSAI